MILMLASLMQIADTAATGVDRRGLPRFAFESSDATNLNSLTGN